MRFSVLAPDVDEIVDGAPEEVAVQNARRKAEAVIPSTEAAVLGADTVVSLDGTMYDKPSGPAQARSTLEALSGRAHTVTSGICLITPEGAQTAAVATRVRFRDLDRELIDWYVASGEWAGRAGGYAIQGRGGALVARIDGDYLNVVGLPVSRLLDLAPWLLGAFGV